MNFKCLAGEMIVRPLTEDEEQQDKLNVKGDDDRVLKAVVIAAGRQCARIQPGDAVLVYQGYLLNFDVEDQQMFFITIDDIAFAYSANAAQ